MTPVHEVVVVGLGAAGASTLRSLARRGIPALGLDRFRPPHARGSSHGETRIIRKAYFENPLYVPMVERAQTGWEELERETSTNLLSPCPAVMVGPGDGPLVRGARASAQSHGIPFREWGGNEAEGQMPWLRLPPGFRCFEESGAGVLRPETAIEATLTSARNHGARIRMDARLQAWRVQSDGLVALEVETGEEGPQELMARRVVLAAGAWNPQLLARLKLPFQVERQIFFWFRPRDSHHSYALGHFPVVLWESEPDRIHYVIPDVGSGVKAALHHGGVTVDPDGDRPDPLRGELEAVRQALERTLPGVPGVMQSHATCLYTNVPDHDFILDHHPFHSQVVVASPCSGHGFKFAPILGEILADLAEHIPPPFDLTPFRISRWDQ
ncbi:MAG: N-methyl-L-tryptophan oxidase [Gemmatimonadota bacterium]